MKKGVIIIIIIVVILIVLIFGAYSIYQNRNTIISKNQSINNSVNNSELNQLEVKEEDIVSCQVDSDCIIVPYSHCCGASKKAINKKYLDIYNSKPEWQVYNKSDCAYMGICPSDINVNSSKCEETMTDHWVCVMVYNKITSQINLTNDKTIKKRYTEQECTELGGDRAIFSNSANPYDCSFPTNDSGKICNSTNDCESFCSANNQSQNYYVDNVGKYVGSGKCYSQTIASCLNAIDNGRLYHENCDF